MKGRGRGSVGSRGPLGLRELLEPAIRRVVATRLGISDEWLTTMVSFEQDLAATRIDLIEFAVDVEREMGVHLEEHAIDGVHTYADFVDLVIAAHGRAPECPQPVQLRAAVVPARRDGRGFMARASSSSPYELETIIDDARRAGPGACLTLTVPVGTPVETIAHVERRLACLACRDIVVRVSPGESLGRAVA